MTPFFVSDHHDDPPLLRIPPLYHITICIFIVILHCLPYIYYYSIGNRWVWQKIINIKEVLLDVLNDSELLQWRKVHHHHVSIDRLPPDGITWYSTYGSFSCYSSAQGGRHSGVLVSRPATDRGISYYRLWWNSPPYYDTTAISYNHQYVLGTTMVYLIRLLLEKYNQQSSP